MDFLAKLLKFKVLGKFFKFNFKLNLKNCIYIEKENFVRSMWNFTRKRENIALIIWRKKKFNGYKFTQKKIFCKTKWSFS